MPEQYIFDMNWPIIRFNNFYVQTLLCYSHRHTHGHTHPHTGTHTISSLQWPIDLPDTPFSLSLGRLPAQPSLPLSLSPSLPLSLFLSLFCTRYLSLSLSLSLCFTHSLCILYIPSQASQCCIYWNKWLRHFQWCRCSQTSLSVVDSLCEAVQQSDGSDGRAGQVHWARTATNITCGGDLVRTTTEKGRGGAESLESRGLAVSTNPPNPTLSHMHTQTHSPPASPFFPPCLSPPLSDAGVVNSRTLSWAAWRHREGQGAQVKAIFYSFFSL